MLDGVVAGIVTYNPEIERFRAGCQRIVQQVKKIYVYDNGSANIADLEQLCNEFGNIDLLKSGTNHGIAYALNRVYERALTDNFEWILTLDHDSIVPNGMVEDLAKHKDLKDNIGILCPFIVDQRRQLPLMVAHGEMEWTNFCMTSGSFVNLSAWNSVGKYDERLFIDLVDDDFCIKMLTHGYRILRVNDIILDHELGNLSESPRAKLFQAIAETLKLPKLKKLCYRREVNPLRLYYATRNIIYLNNKYRFLNRRYYKKKNYFLNGILSILRGKHKWKLMKAFCRGVKEGRKMDVRYS